MKNNSFKRFLFYYKPHWKLFALDLICAFGLAIIDLIFPLATNKVLKNYLPNGQYRMIVMILIGILVIYIVRAVLEYIVNYWGHILGVRMEYDMRNDLFTHLQKQSFEFYDKNRTGKIMSRVIHDLNEITEFAHHGPEDLFLSLVMLIGSFVILLTIYWKLAIIVYIFVPVMIYFAMYQRVKMRKGFKLVKENIADVNATLESSLTGIRVAKSFANEAYEMEKFKEGNIRFKGAKNVAYRNMAIFQMGIHSLSRVLNLTALTVGAYFVYNKNMDSTDLLTFMLYINIFMQPIRRLSNFAQQFESGMTGIERFAEFMDEKPTIQDNKDAKVLKNLKGDIQFSKVSFAYKDEDHVLQDIDLFIEAGKTLALVGPSGGGKTTLCHLIPRFYDIKAGSLKIDEEDIRDLTVESLRKNIGLVSQDVFLFASTIRDNILYGRLDATDEEMVEATKSAEIHDFIMSLPEGYDTEVGERGIRLSGGQKQRIAIARVFLKNPPILLLDEATSALDNETEVKIQRALKKLSVGRTTLVIAHRLSTIKDADEIVVITPEGIIEKGNHDALVAKDKIYAKLYKAQFKGFIPDEYK